jgi:hypothetical protein
MGSKVANKEWLSLVVNLTIETWVIQVLKNSAVAFVSEFKTDITKMEEEGAVSKVAPVCDLNSLITIGIGCDIRLDWSVATLLTEANGLLSLRVLVNLNDVLVHQDLKTILGNVSDVSANKQW